MTSIFRLTPLLTVSLLTMLAGCVTTSSPVIRRNADAIATASAATPSDAIEGTEATSPVRPRITTGSGQLINERAAAERCCCIG